MKVEVDIPAVVAAGAGGNPVNPGHPFVFKRNAYLIWLRNFQLQLALLDQGVFPVPSGGEGAVPQTTAQTRHR